jgi:hypothetical protein
MSGSIFDPPSAPTTAQLQSQFAQAMVTGTQQALKGLVAQYLRLYKLLWGVADPGSPQGAQFAQLTIPQRIAALGTNAASLFGEASALATYIAARVAVYQAANPTGTAFAGLSLPGTPAGYTLTINADGSATVTLA